MNICRFEDIRTNIIDLLKNKKVVPLLGSGFSKGSDTGKNSMVPSGTEFKKIMLSEMKEKCNFQESTFKKLQADSFSKICEVFENQEKITKSFKRNLYAEKFLDVSLNKPQKKFLEIDWPYIYTLNFDDAIEKNSEYNTVLCANRNIDLQIFDERKCVIKIHGDITDYIKYKDSTKIFSSSEYVESLKQNQSLLEKLKHDWLFCNFFIIGCSFEDEIDLLSIQKTILSENKASLKQSRRFWFTNENPDEYTQLTLEQYNITDVVVCSSYERIYLALFEAWEEATKLTPSQLFDFRSLKIKDINDEIENKKYFFFGKNLLNNKTKEISIPSFFTSREIKEKITTKFFENTIHLVRGNRLSGRTYLLFDIFKDFVGSHKTYIFNGHDCINTEAFEFLLNEKGAVILFDINSINQNQFRLLIKSYDKIHSNKTNVIVMLGNNASDFFGILKISLMDSNKNNDNFLRYELTNRFSNSETAFINEKLSKLTIPNFFMDRTILDNLITISEKANLYGEKSRFERLNFECNTEKELVFFIILAAKGKISTYDLSFFEITSEAYAITSKYPEIFEETAIENFEQDFSKNAQSKIILNSEYWLTRELGNFASNELNEEKIISAYKLLVLKTILKTKNIYEASKKYKDYILYDVINNTFLQNTKDKRHMIIELIMHIYEGLKEHLSTDYQFVHQYAKSCLHYSRTLSESEEKLNYLKNASMNAVSAESQIQAIITSSKNNYLNIALAHIQYTLATIHSEICEVEHYENTEHIKKTVELINTAISSPHNSDDYRRDNTKSIGIKKFIDHLMLSAQQNLKLDNKSQKTISFVINLVKDILSNDNWETINNNSGELF